MLLDVLKKINFKYIQLNSMFRKKNFLKFISLVLEYKNFLKIIDLT